MYGNVFSFFWVIDWIDFWYFISKRNKLVIGKTFKKQKGQHLLTGADRWR